VPLRPNNSTWHALYVDPVITPKFRKRFRLRFRLPYEEYKLLLTEVKTDDRYFKRWNGKDAVGTQASPLELLLLGGLRYLGRGWTLDDLEESTGIDRETHRQFLHAFIDYGSTPLYRKHVTIPAEDALENNSFEYSVAGFHGAIGSMDGTHVIQWCVSFKQQNMHLGWKDKHTTRTYNLTCNHRRRILCTTKGHPGTYNDKMLVRFDEVITAVKRGELYQDNIFELYEQSVDGTVNKVKYRGVWFLCDNGYLNWGITIPPFKNSTDYREIRFSEWLESMRKDVECCFGIMKGRWRCLKTGIRLHGVDAGDKIWLTCCALHNRLLEVDGLDNKWEQGVPSDWQSKMGEHEQADAPLAIQRLNAPSLIRNYDTTEQHGSADVVLPPEDSQLVVNDPSADGTGAIPVRNLSMKCFRQKLVEHFDICFQKKELHWPTRLKNFTPRNI